MYLYEVKVAYTRQTGEDKPCKIKESYIVRDETFGGAELKVLEHIAKYVFDLSEAAAIKRINAYDFVNTVRADKIFRCKCAMITIDDNGSEHRKNVYVYVGATTLEEARKTIAEYLVSLDSELIAVEETKIIEVLNN